MARVYSPVVLSQLSGSPTCESVYVTPGRNSTTTKVAHIIHLFTVVILARRRNSRPRGSARRDLLCGGSCAVLCGGDFLFLSLRDNNRGTLEGKAGDGLSDMKRGYTRWNARIFYHCLAVAR